MEDLASVLPECPHLSFRQVHHIKGEVPLTVLIPSFTFQTHIVSASFHLLWVGSRNRVQAGKKAKGRYPSAFSSGLLKQREATVQNSVPKLTKDKERSLGSLWLIFSVPPNNSPLAYSPRL